MSNEPNWDQSLYARHKSAATRLKSGELSTRYHRHLDAHPDADSDGGYGSCTTLRTKLAWLEARGA